MRKTNVLKTFTTMRKTIALLTYLALMLTLSCQTSDSERVISSRIKSDANAREVTRCVDPVKRQEPDLIIYPTDGETVRTSYLDVRWDTSLETGQYMNVVFQKYEGGNWITFYSSVRTISGSSGSVGGISPPGGGYNVPCRVYIEPYDGCTYDQNYFTYAPD